MSHPGVDFVRQLFGEADLDRGTVLERREGMAQMVGDVAPPEGIVAEPMTLGGRPAERLSPSRPPAQQVVLYLHGGGYCMGDLTSHRDFGGRLALVTGADVITLEYRLAPEHPYPAALDDALAAYRELVARPDRPTIAIAGDSAGGGLALAAVVALREQGDPLPVAVVALSPWADLTQSSPAFERNEDRDPSLSKDALDTMAEAYLDGVDPTNHLVSPSFADYHGFPPLHLEVGGLEVLEDDAAGVATAARESGVDVELVVWPELFHVFQAYPPELIPEAGESLEGIGRFLSQHLADPPD